MSGNLALDHVDAIVLTVRQPNWTRLLATGSEIKNYLSKVCDVFDLKKYMQFCTEVRGLYWQEGVYGSTAIVTMRLTVGTEAGKWNVKLRKCAEDGTFSDYEDKCDIILYNKGLLNTSKWPNDIRGFEKFKGKVRRNFEHNDRC